MRRRQQPLIALLFVALFVAGCAARASIQQSALVVGELALAVDQAERDAYAAKLYDEAKHKALGAGVLRLLYAARAYERGVVNGGDLATLRGDLRRVLEDVAQAATGVAPLQTALNAVRAALGGVS